MLGGKFPALAGEKREKSPALAGERCGRKLWLVREKLSGVCRFGKFPVFARESCRHNSGDIARHRLKLLLASDKVRCSPGLIEMMKDDLIGVLSKYVEIDSGRMELGITKTVVAGSSETIPALFANIPIRAISDKGIE